ncbi:hypothetical protein [Stappia sp.]|uniref:hypothetical protein n=1 Tax=Stappia sp. TaxID=1870903 RepID=UPI0032D91624
MTAAIAGAGDPAPASAGRNWPVAAPVTAAARPLASPSSWPNMDGAVPTPAIAWPGPGLARAVAAPSGDGAGIGREVESVTRLSVGDRAGRRAASAHFSSQ